MDVYSRFLNSRISCFLNNDHVDSFKDILEMSHEKAIHQKNLGFLAKEIRKFVTALSLPVMYDLFTIRENLYKLGSFQILYSSNKRTVEF